jgi:hypothetical protein
VEGRAGLGEQRLITRGSPRMRLDTTHGADLISTSV